MQRRPREVSSLWSGICISLSNNFESTILNEGHDMTPPFKNAFLPSKTRHETSSTVESHSSHVICSCEEFL